MGKYSKKNIQKRNDLTYLAFCEKCNSPREISKYIIEEYMKPNYKNYFICHECFRKNYLPPYFNDLIDELKSSI